MLYELKNNELSVTVSDLGAELTSVRCASGCEYLWQGNPDYWTGRAPLMFPICGRLFTGKYTYEGKTYEMSSTHGFARSSVFDVERVGEDTLRFFLEANAQTKEIYPFDFLLTVEYRLTGNRLDTCMTVRNTGDAVLPAVMGFHPGFNVPLDSEGSFEDWRLEFSEDCSPDEILMSDTCFLTGKRRAYPLEKGRILRLRHSLFDVDAVFMSNVAHSVTLCSDKSARFVKMEYPDLPYLGVWHKPRSNAPYACIEPWRGLPSFDGQVDDFAQKSDMLRLQPNTEQSVHCSLLFG